MSTVRALIPPMAEAMMSGVVCITQNYPQRTFTLTYIDGKKESARISKKVLGYLPDDSETFTGSFFSYVSAIQSAARAI